MLITKMDFWISIFIVVAYTCRPVQAIDATNAANTVFNYGMDSEPGDLGLESHHPQGDFPKPTPTQEDSMVWSFEVSTPPTTPPTTPPSTPSTRPTTTRYPGAVDGVELLPQGSCVGCPFRMHVGEEITCSAKGNTPISYYFIKTRRSDPGPELVQGNTLRIVVAMVGKETHYQCVARNWAGWQQECRKNLTIIALIDESFCREEFFNGVLVGIIVVWIGIGIGWCIFKCCCWWECSGKCCKKKQSNPPQTQSIPDPQVMQPIITLSEYDEMNPVTSSTTEYAEIPNEVSTTRGSTAGPVSRRPIGRHTTSTLSGTVNGGYESAIHGPHAPEEKIYEELHLVTNRSDGETKAKGEQGATSTVIKIENEATVELQTSTKTEDKVLQPTALPVLCNDDADKGVSTNIQYEMIMEDHAAESGDKTKSEDEPKDTEYEEPMPGTAIIAQEYEMPHSQGENIKKTHSDNKSKPNEYEELTHPIAIASSCEGQNTLKNVASTLDHAPYENVAL